MKTWRWIFKYINLALGTLLVLVGGLGTAQAEPFQDCFRYGSYGIVAGALVGGTAMALSEDPGSTLSPIARGASLGLYAGLLVAAYNEWNHRSEPTLMIQPLGQNFSEAPTYGLIWTRRF